MVDGSSIGLIIVSLHVVVPILGILLYGILVKRKQLQAEKRKFAKLVLISRGRGRGTSKRH